MTYDILTHTRTLIAFTNIYCMDTHYSYAIKDIRQYYIYMISEYYIYIYIFNM